MTIAAAKKKLHDYIDHADENKVVELLSLFEDGTEKSGFVYDEETLNMLRERSTAYFSGKEKAYSVEESMELIRKHRQKNGF